MEKQVKPIRCLVIQLARLGDTVQSLMALRSAQQQYPTLEITFVTRESFSEAAKRCGWLKDIICLPTRGLLEPYLQGSASKELTLDRLGEWLSPLRKETWDLVVNWSFSEPSSYLTSLIPAKFKLGYSRRPDATLSPIGLDGWSHYIQAVVQQGIAQNIHLVDILSTQILTALQIHYGESSHPTTPLDAKSFFSFSLTKEEEKAFALDASKRWIGIQLGSGKEMKSWDPAHWAALAKRVLEHPDNGILLFGSEKDHDRGQIFLEHLENLVQGCRDRLINFVGETHFDAWAHLIGQCEWLFASDTAAVHVASVLGTRVLNVSFGPARFLETGPYGNGHYVVTAKTHCLACRHPSQGAHHSCHREIHPEAVYAVWVNGTSHPSQEERSIRAYRSQIRPPAQGGGVVYRPIFPHSVGLNEWMASVMGYIARSWYCGWVPPMAQEMNRQSIHSSLLQKLRELKQSSEVLFKVCEQARRTALLLSQKSIHLRSDKLMAVKDREEINHLGKTLGELDALLERLAKSHPPLTAFSQMSKVLMHHLQGSQLAELGKEAAHSYKQLSDGVVLLRGWIDFTLDLAKPIALRSQHLSLVGTQESSP